MSSGTNGGIYATRTARIVALLALQQEHGELPRRVSGYLRTNPYGPLDRAALHVARRVAAGHRSLDPWADALALVNREHARASLARSLVHWIEDGLRARVDVVFGQALGDDWFRSLDNYVATRGLVPGQIGFDYLRNVKWVDDARAPAGKRPDPTMYPDSEAFLQDLAFGDLASIVRYAYDNPQRRLVLGLAELECRYTACDPFQDRGAGCCTSPHRHSTGRLIRMTPTCKSNTVEIPAGSLLVGSRVASMLKSVRDARNLIDHNKPVSANLQRESWRDGTHLLVALEFDLAKATRRLERQRLLEVDLLLKGYGTAEGAHAITGPEGLAASTRTTGDTPVPPDAGDLAPGQVEGQPC